MSLFKKNKTKEVTGVTINVSGKDENGYSISIADYRIKSLADAHNFLNGVKVMWNLPEQSQDEEETAEPENKGQKSEEVF